MEYWTVFNAPQTTEKILNFFFFLVVVVVVAVVVVAEIDN
jgi:hypothetical protein